MHDPIDGRNQSASSQPLTEGRAIAESDVASELPLLWQREMLCRGAYIPMRMELISDDGVVFGHWSAFTKNPESEKHVDGMSREVTVRRLATATGGLGSCTDYLFQTRNGLRAHGIPDPTLEQLTDQVAAMQAERTC